MIKIYDRLFIGNQTDYEFKVRGRSGWSIIHACKEPYHRQELGYKGRSAPKNHPEYLIAKRNNRLILNLIDTDDPKYIPKIIIDEALNFIRRQLEKGRFVLVHCNQGESRSASIGLLYLAINELIPNGSLKEAEVAYKRIYPLYNPSPGIRGFIKKKWMNYNK